MSRFGLKNAINLEWVNVTYRSIGLSAMAVISVGALVGGWWFYNQRFSPREEAQDAIRRAEFRLQEAGRLEQQEAVQEILASARVSLDLAHRELSSASFKPARIAAIRSEQLSTKAISLAGGDEAKARMVKFKRVEGDVRVKAAGEFSWQRAEHNMLLRIGDQVKTSSSGSAELIYFDGTITTVRPGSLLEIRDLYEDPVTRVRRVSETLSWGEVHASTQARNVNGSYHEVATEEVRTRSEEAGEFQVSFNKDQKTSVVSVFEGRIKVATDQSQDTVTAGERIKAGSEGRLSAKESLPGVPRLLVPSDQRVFLFEDPIEQQISLQWEKAPGAARYRLMIADRPLFTEPLYDAERDTTSAVIDGVPVGDYFWRVAGISRTGSPGPFSESRGFRVSSQQIRDRGDADPPRLEVTEFVTVGQMVIINGVTEPGANLCIDNLKIDVYDNGTFNAVVRLSKEGVNEVLLVAQDGAGNETTVKRSVFVEIF
jgi:hypothetical protein